MFWWLWGNIKTSSIFSLPMQHHPTPVRLKRCFWTKSASDGKKHFWSNQEQPRLNLVSRPLSRVTGRLAPEFKSNDHYLIRSAFIWCKGSRQKRRRICYGQAGRKGGWVSSASAITVGTCENFYPLKIHQKGLKQCFSTRKRLLFCTQRNADCNGWVNSYRQPGHKKTIFYNS